MGCYSGPTLNDFIMAPAIFINAGFMTNHEMSHAITVCEIIKIINFYKTIDNKLLLCITLSEFLFNIC